MARKTTRKHPTYLQLLDGRYFVRVPVKSELRRYVGVTEAREALGPDRRIAKDNLHAHVAVFKQRLREAGEAYAYRGVTVTAWRQRLADESRLA